MNKSIVGLFLILSIFFVALPIYGVPIGTINEEIQYLESATRIINALNDITAPLRFEDTKAINQAHKDIGILLEQAQKLEVPDTNNPYWLTCHFLFLGMLTRTIDSFDTTLSYSQRADAGGEAIQFGECLVLLLTDSGMITSIEEKEGIGA